MEETYQKRRCDAFLHCHNDTMVGADSNGCGSKLQAEFGYQLSKVCLKLCGRAKKQVDEKVTLIASMAYST